ncbi:MAG: cation:proton antiporter [Pseudomonadota bacterium]
MYYVILLIGILIFVAHFFTQLFRKTHVPDVLLLMLLGMAAGPVLGLVSPGDFGKVGSVLSTIALVVILFESGISLNLKVLKESLGTTGKLTLTCFAASIGAVAVIGHLMLDLPWISAVTLGAILGGTASAVVIPLVSMLGLSEKPATVLVLESALTDVLCILGVFALLQMDLQGAVDPARLVGSVLAALIFAMVIGVLGGLGWMLMLHRIRDIPNTISSTVASVFIVYGITEALGFSGAIASLAFGITLSNYEQLGMPRIKLLTGKKVTPLTDTELLFYAEAVFLLKTFFFVYLGISIQFGAWDVVLVASIMVFALFLIRLIVTRSTVGEGFTPRDAAITSMMGPKGLAAAVLATVPVQQGMVGGELMRDTTYMVVLLSILLCALLVALYPNRLVRQAYDAVFASRRVDAGN